MFRYIEAPNYVQLKHWDKSIFLGGSISGAYDWQENIVNKLIPYFDVVNPRRKNYDMNDSSQERIQISWEHHYLNICEHILFYFDSATLAPITLLELGALLEQSKTQLFKKIHICIHPEYKRKNDVIIQTELRNPKFARNFFYNLDEMTDYIIKTYATN